MPAQSAHLDQGPGLAPRATLLGEAVPCGKMGGAEAAIHQRRQLAPHVPQPAPTPRARRVGRACPSRLGGVAPTPTSAPSFIVLIPAAQGARALAAGMRRLRCSIGPPAGDRPP